MKTNGIYFVHSNLLFNLEKIKKFYNSLIDAKTITIMDLEAFYWEDNDIVQKNFNMRLPFYIGAVTLIWDGRNFKINNYRKFYFYDDVNLDNLSLKQLDITNRFIKYTNIIGTEALLFLGGSIELNYINNFFPKNFKFKYFDLYKELDEAKFINPSIIRNREIISTKKNSNLDGKIVRRYATEDMVINKKDKYLTEIIDYNKEELMNAALFIKNFYRIINDNSLIKYKIEQLK